MFGVVPRVIWEKSIAPDERGRIVVAHNCLLLAPSDDPSKAILIETGSGDKFDAKNRDVFGLSGPSIRDVLAAREIDVAAVSDVILTHLHFDHAGGATRLDESGQSVPTFPNATIHVQRREWDDANANNSVMTRTYLRENLEPLRNRLKLIDSPVPFPNGHLPARDEMPSTTLDGRLTEILPGIFAFNTPGHTWGQQAILFHDADGQPTVFVADLIPTAHHVGAAYNMAYDVEPFISMITRRWFLTEAAARNWKLILVHDPGAAIYRVSDNGKGWFSLTSNA